MNNVLTIIVPIYNEADNLNNLFIALDELINTTEYTINVLLINDGSKDDSKQIIDLKCNVSENYNSINFKINQGLSRALYEGFNLAETEIIGYLDADLQTTPLDFLKLFKYIDHFDLVTGIRTNRQDNFFKKFSSDIANSIRRFIIKDSFKDINCPLKIIRKEFAVKLPYFDGMHRFIPAFVEVYGGKVKQVPVSHYPRMHGKSKFGLSNRFLGPLIDCFKFLRLKKRISKK